MGEAQGRNHCRILDICNGPRGRCSAGACGYRVFHQYDTLETACNASIQATLADAQVDSVAQCQMMCDTTTSCNAFNTDGESCTLYQGARRECTGKVGHCSG